MMQKERMKKSEVLEKREKLKLRKKTQKKTLDCLLPNKNKSQSKREANGRNFMYQKLDIERLYVWYGDFCEEKN